MALLPNWPLLAVDIDCTQGPPNGPGPNRVSLNSLGMGVSQLSASRGRQYELGNAEAGTASVAVNDPGELLNPANTASPLNSAGQQLLPYRALQISAMWPLTGNIINPGVNAAFDSSFESGIGGFQTLAPGTTLTSSTAQSFVGTHSLAVTQGLAGSAFGVFLQIPGVPGVVYTVSAYVYVAPTPAGTTVQLGLSSGSASVASGVASTAGVWQRLTATYTADGAVQTFLIGGSGAGGLAFFVDAIQLELGDTASVYGATGPTLYGIHTGYVERYPQTWRDRGMWGVKPLESVDALSVLSRTIIRQSYEATIAADQPNLYIPYNDQSAPQAVILPQGGSPFIGYTSIGENGQVNFGGDQFLDGTATVKLAQQNLTGVIGQRQFITYLGTLQGQLSMDTQAFTIEVWARVTSGLPYFGAGAPKPGEDVNQEPYGPAFGIGWYTFNTGDMGWEYSDPNGFSKGGYFPAGGWAGYPDGNWHYLAIKLVGSNGLVSVVDNLVSGVTTISTSQSVMLDNFYVNAQAFWTNPITEVSVARMATYPVALSDAQLLNHYQRGIGYLGELTLDRASRVLSQYWAGAFTTTSSGVVPMAPDYSYNGRAVLDVLQEITVTDNGLVYVTGAGQVVVEGRDDRYRKQTAQWVFGERTDLGEKPYTNLAYDYDPTYLYAEAQINRPGGPVYSVVNQNALAAYGQRVFTRTLQAATDWEAQQAAAAFARRYGEARLRVQSITLDPSSNPDLWPVALGVEVSQRVTVNRRTGAGVTVTGDYFVEKVSHAVDSDSFKWTVTLQLSPVFVDTAWILGDPVYGVLGSTTVCVY